MDIFWTNAKERAPDERKKKYKNNFALFKNNNCQESIRAIAGILFRFFSGLFVPFPSISNIVFCGMSPVFCMEFLEISVSFLSFLLMSSYLILIWSGLAIIAGQRI